MPCYIKLGFQPNWTRSSQCCALAYESSAIKQNSPVQDLTRKLLNASFGVGFVD